MSGIEREELLAALEPTGEFRRPRLNEWFYCPLCEVLELCVFPSYCPEAQIYKYKLTAEPAAGEAPQPIAWRYTVLVDKHATGTPLPGEISMLDISRQVVWGKPGHWRYSDGPDKPQIDWMCEAEPLYGHGIASPQPPTSGECPTIRYISRVVERLFDSARSQVVREWWDVILPLVQQEQPCHSPALRQQLAECERQREDNLAAIAVSIRKEIKAIEERDEARREVENVERVIGFAESGIERKGRDLHDWLAQILQALVIDAGCVPILKRQLDAALAAKAEAEGRILQRISGAIGLMNGGPQQDAVSAWWRVILPFLQRDPAEPAGKEGE